MLQPQCIGRKRTRCLWPRPKVAHAVQRGCQSSPLRMRWLSGLQAPPCRGISALVGRLTAGSRTDASKTSPLPERLHWDDDYESGCLTSAAFLWQATQHSSSRPPPTIAQQKESSLQRSSSLSVLVCSVTAEQKAQLAVETGNQRQAPQATVVSAAALHSPLFLESGLPRHRPLL